MALLVKSFKECRRQSAIFGLHSLTSPDTTAQHREPNERETYGLDLFIRQTSNLICVTGAGVSTSSGLPDYRGINGSYKRGHKPMVHAEFVNSTSSRQRYWSRSMAGWNRVHLSQPNDSHYALASLEYKQRLNLLVTQNVDGLHEVAGSHNVTDLHGRIDEVICLQCRNISSRVAFQRELLAKNPEYVDFLQNFSRNPTTNTNLARADGDVDLGNTYDYSSFCVPDCPLCGGVLKPNVVFFGDNVPVKKVEETYNEVDKADGLLVVGTSLEVFSAYRFVIRADKLGIPIAIINHGETRAERSKLPNIRYKSDANCGNSEFQFARLQDLKWYCNGISDLMRLYSRNLIIKFKSGGTRDIQSSDMSSFNSQQPGSFSNFKTTNFHQNSSFGTSTSRKYLESQLFQDAYVPDIMPYSEFDDGDNDGDIPQFPDHAFFNNGQGDFSVPGQLNIGAEPYTPKMPTSLLDSSIGHKINPQFSSGHNMGMMSKTNYPDEIPYEPFQFSNSTSKIHGSVSTMPQMPIPQMEMFIYMVAFKRHSKEYMLGARFLQPITVGDAVIVATDRGEHLGIVTHIFPFDQYLHEKFADSALPDFDITKFVGKIIRIASTRECRLLEIKARDEEQVLRYARHIAQNVYRLRIQIFDAEYQFDRFQITIFYDVIQRLDFRNFVRDLHSTFNARIWMEREKQAK